MTLVVNDAPDFNSVLHLHMDCYMSHSARTCCLILLALVGIVGCDSSATVTGKITLDNAPLPTGEVTFYPSAQGALAIGTVVNGSYELAIGQSDKIEPGDYRVTVVATGIPAAGLTTGADGRPTETVGERLTPDIYADSATTPLKATVKPGANSLDFDLKTQP